MRLGTKRLRLNRFLPVLTALAVNAAPHAAQADEHIVRLLQITTCIDYEEGVGGLASITFFFMLKVLLWAVD